MSHHILHVLNFKKREKWSDGGYVKCHNHGPESHGKMLFGYFPLIMVYNTFNTFADYLKHKGKSCSSREPFNTNWKQLYLGELLTQMGAALRLGVKFKAMPALLVTGGDENHFISVFHQQKF